MKVKYTPAEIEVRDKVAEGDSTPLLGDEFEGFVEIRMPSYPERLRFPKELGVANMVDADKESEDAKENVLRNLKNMDLLATCAEKVKPFIEAVEIKHKPSGVELKNADDLYDHPIASAIVAGICSKFLMGFLQKKA